MKRYINKLILFCLVGTQLAAQDTSITNTIGIEMVLIRPGSFIMGKFQPPYPHVVDTGNSTAGSNEARGYNAAEQTFAKKLAEQDAQPGFTATIKKSFYIGKFEVTQAQWKAVMGTNPSVFQGNKVSDNADRHPVENVRWNDVQQFLKKLNVREKGKH